jgi:hypothetical protein
MNKALIVFTDVHLAYSPTVLQLYKELKNKFDVYLLAPEPMKAFSSLKINDPNIIYFDEENNYTREQNLLQKLIRKTKNYFFPPKKEEQIKSMLLSPKAKTIISYINKFKGEIIAVDFLGLWCSQQVVDSAHLVSLEIHENDTYREYCNFGNISSVLIQSEERYKYLFKNAEIPKFIVQNAPAYLDFDPDLSSRSKYDLIYCGSAVAWFGVFSCLDFIRDFSEYKLTLKGALPVPTRESINLFYKDLITENRLILDQDYLEGKELALYVSRFRMGFAFYDFYRFDNVRTFNYFTAPSGKVFQYLNSGVPIIANKLPGFAFIEEMNSGRLVSHLSSITIKKAIDDIEFSYNVFAKNAKKASYEFDFIKNINPFIQYICDKSR